MQKNDDLNRIVSLAGKIVVLAVPLGLPFSIMYDFGFFYALGVSIRTLPTEFSDHLMTALVWLPVVFTVSFGALIWLLGVRGSLATDMKFTEKQKGRLLTMSKYLSSALFLVTLWKSQNAEGASFYNTAWICFSSLLIALYLWSFNLPKGTALPYSNKFTGILTMISIALTVSFSQGAITAHEIANTAEATQRFYFQSPDREPVDVVIVRALRMGALVREPKLGRNSFILWSTVLYSEQLDSHLRGLARESPRGKK